MTILIDIEDINAAQKTIKGIKFVLVNGVTVIRDGRHTGTLPGRTLRKRHEAVP